MTDEQAKQLAELRAKHGEDLAAFPTSLGFLVFKSPDRDIYEDFLEAVASDKGKKSVAMRSIALRCAVHPTKDIVDEIFKKKPGLPATIAARLVEMSTEDVEDVAKKG